MTENQIILAIRLPRTEGNIAIHVNMHSAHNKVIYIFLLISALRNWFIIFIGLNDNSNLPSGCGNYGEWFGVSLAFPTGFLSAISPGKTSI